MRIVPLPLTEEAIRLIRVTHADFVKLGREASARKGESSRRGEWFGNYDFQQVRAQSHFLRMVSIVEAYLDSLSTQLFSVRTAGLDEFYRKLATAADSKSATNWAERHQSFATYHQVVLKQRAKWSVLEAAIQARNSIAHGLGGLTRLQRKDATRQKIRSIGVHLAGDRLHLTDLALVKCRDACVDFIQDVDREIPRPIR